MFLFDKDGDCYWFKGILSVTCHEGELLSTNVEYNLHDLTLIVGAKSQSAFVEINNYLG